jgi:guanylate kinase
MKKRLILVGKSAAGKDHARKVCEQWFNMPYAVSYTTRPPRDGEMNGIDYHFISKEEFEEMIDSELWYEWVMFNGWYYGTTNEQMEQDRQVFIMTPYGLSHLSEKDRNESLVAYLDIDEEIRKARMYERGGNADSVDRRLAADAIDFAGFVNYDIKITDPYYKISIFSDPIQKWFSPFVTTYEKSIMSKN